MTTSHYAHIEPLLQLQEDLHTWAGDHSIADLVEIAQQPRSRDLLRAIAADFATLETAILAALAGNSDPALSQNSQKATPKDLPPKPDTV